MEGLYEAGYVDAERKVRVDVLHIPHFGNDRNVSEEFFRSVIAKDYIITGDGRHNNPEPDTLNMLVRARANESYTLDFAYRIEPGTRQRRRTRASGRPIWERTRRVLRQRTRRRRELPADLPPAGRKLAAYQFTPTRPLLNARNRTRWWNTLLRMFELTGSVTSTE